MGQKEAESGRRREGSKVWPSPRPNWCSLDQKIPKGVWISAQLIIYKSSSVRPSLRSLLLSQISPSTMARTRERSCSPHPPDSPTAKRLKTSHLSSSQPHNGVNGAVKPLPATTTTTKPKLGAASIEVAAKSAQGDRENVSRFHNGLFEHENISRLHSSYAASAPFKHTVVDKLFQHDLLVNVKEECLRELSFTEKETDIYKVRPQIRQWRRGHGT